MYSLINKIYEFFQNSIPATTIPEVLPTATDLVLEVQPVDDVDEIVPVANIIAADIPTAAVGGPLLTIFGCIQQYYYQLNEEVFCTHAEFTQLEAAKSTARKYQNMNLIEQGKLRDSFEKILNESVTNIITADNPTEVMKNAARAGVLDLVTYKQNRIKDLEMAKQEIGIIFGKSELDKMLAKQNQSCITAQRLMH